MNQFKENNALYFPSLDNETRNRIPTDADAFYLGRKPQTFRAWASLENGPIRPIRIHGRLSWSVAEIRALLGMHMWESLSSMNTQVIICPHVQQYLL